MSAFADQLAAIEQRAEAALGALEHEGRWEAALEVHRAAGAEVEALAIPRRDPAYKEARRLRAQCLLREANALRALGRHAEAGPVAERQLSAAMASGHHLSIAQAMFSLGVTCVVNGEVERGLRLLDETRPMFEHHADAEHREGLGWWYVAQADLGNTGLVAAPPERALECAQNALALLRPLNHWPGVARAHAARAAAYDRLGDTRSAAVARTAANMAAAMASGPPGKSGGA
jgi:hypothetical protein